MKKTTILCPATLTLGLISSKWKAHLLAHFGQAKEGLRFGELTRILPSISKKVLAESLNELVEDGFLIRKEYPEVPPRVVYTLSQQGNDVQAVIQVLAKFGLEYMEKNQVKLLKQYEKNVIEEQIQIGKDMQII